MFRLPVRDRALLICVFVLATSGVAAAPIAPGRVTLEIDAQAEGLVDARAARRLVALELSDVEIPPGNFGRLGTRPPALFYRVLGRAEQLRIELWERGEFHGARMVSGSGSPQLRSRRVALAAVELARLLRQRRLTEERREQARLRAERQAAEHRARAESALALEATVLGALVGPSDLWLVGPTLGSRVAVSRALELGLGASWLLGESPTASALRAEWLELRMQPTYVWGRDESLRLAVGLDLAAAVVHLAGLGSVDAVPGQNATWSARAALDLRVEPRLGDRLRLTVGPMLGLVLRRMPIEDATGESRRLGGAWLGASAGVVIDPAWVSGP